MGEVNIVVYLGGDPGPLKIQVSPHT